MLRRSLLCTAILLLANGSRAQELVFSKEHQLCFHQQQALTSALVSLHRDDSTAAPGVEGPPGLFAIPYDLLRDHGLLNLGGSPNSRMDSWDSYRYQRRGSRGVQVSCLHHGSPNLPVPVPLRQARDGFPVPELRRCIAIQRVISGAVELYLLDHHPEGGGVPDIPWNELVGKGYLNQFWSDPGVDEPNSYQNFHLTADSIWGVRCLRHGSVDEWGGDAFLQATQPQ